MLGQVRRTTRTDVGLAISLSGIAYLVWVLVVGVTRYLVDELRALPEGLGPGLKIKTPAAANWLLGAFVHGAPIWDVAGVLWLVLGLVLIVGASRQRWSISWAWLSSICQAMAAALLAVWSGLAARAPYSATLKIRQQLVPSPPFWWTCLSVSVAIALLVWVSVLVWLLYERARLGRGPSLRDSLRTHRT
jgi:hypothetical protein